MTVDVTERSCPGQSAVREGQDRLHVNKAVWSETKGNTCDTRCWRDPSGKEKRTKEEKKCHCEALLFRFREWHPGSQKIVGDGRSDILTIRKSCRVEKQETFEYFESTCKWQSYFHTRKGRPGVTTRTNRGKWIQAFKGVWEKTKLGFKIGH